jgi:hypothetical protein
MNASIGERITRSLMAKAIPTSSQPLNLGERIIDGTDKLKPMEMVNIGGSYSTCTF